MRCRRQSIDAGRVPRLWSNYGIIASRMLPREANKIKVDFSVRLRVGLRLAGAAVCSLRTRPPQIG